MNKEKADNERLRAIILCMFWSHYGEIIREVGEGEDPEWIYHLRSLHYKNLHKTENRVPISHVEFMALRESEIIEIDSANDEPGHEMYVYVLSKDAQQKTKELILKNKLAFSLAG